MSRPRFLLAMAGVAVLALSGCTSTVDRAELEQEVSTRLTEQVGVAPESVDCPDDLDAEQDATTRCTLTAPDGTQIGLTVTVTSVDGDTVNFDVVVDDELMS